MSDVDRGGSRRNTSKDFSSDDAAMPSGLIVTAIPTGRRWRLKALGPDGAVALPDIFRNRLEALGAGVLLAEHCGARVVP